MKKHALLLISGLALAVALNACESKEEVIERLTARQAVADTSRAVAEMIGPLPDSSLIPTDTTRPEAVPEF